MFVSDDPSMQGLSTGSLKVLAGQGGHAVERIPAPFYEELYKDEGDDHLIPKAKKAELTDIGLILHSSGLLKYPFCEGTEH